MKAPGNVFQRQEKVPSWATAIWLAATGAGLAGVKETGRKSSWASSCWSRRVDMGDVVKDTWSAVGRVVGPSAPSMPDGPPGTVTVIAVPGGSVVRGLEGQGVGAAAHPGPGDGRG